MSEVRLDFEWTRAYSPKGSGYEIRNGKITQVGVRKQAYSPFRLGFPIYLEFSQLVQTPEACLSFAERYGLLTSPAQLSKLPSEDLSFWISEIKAMLAKVRMLPNAVKQANSRGTIARMGKLDVLLVPGAGPDASPVMVMEPSDLLQAMNLQLAHFISGGGSLNPCRHCGLIFQAGRAGGKRTLAQFHSDECKNAFHNAKRRAK